MKAIIVEVEGKYMIALKKNGDFIKVKQTKHFSKNISIGQEIDIPSTPKVNINTYAKVASIAAVLLLSIGIGFGSYLYAKPYSYVDVDINPSIEITSNIFNRIIEVKPLNEDGKVVLSTDSYKNMSVPDGVGKILESALFYGYLKSSSSKSVKEIVENEVMLTVSCRDMKKADQLMNSLRIAATKKLKQSKTEWKLLTEKITIQKRNEAGEIGVSPGKILLIEQLNGEDSKADIEKYKDSSVKDIIKAIEEYKKAEMDNTENTSNNEKNKKENSNKKTDKDTGSEQRNKAQQDKKGNNTKAEEENSMKDKQNGNNAKNAKTEKANTKDKEGKQVSGKVQDSKKDAQGEGNIAEKGKQKNKGNKSESEVQQADNKNSYNSAGNSVKGDNQEIADISQNGIKEPGSKLQNKKEEISKSNSKDT